MVQEETLQLDLGIWLKSLGQHSALRVDGRPEPAGEINMIAAPCQPQASTVQLSGKAIGASAEPKLEFLRRDLEVSAKLHFLRSPPYGFCAYVNTQAGHRHTVLRAVVHEKLRQAPLGQDE